MTTHPSFPSPWTAAAILVAALLLPAAAGAAVEDVNRIVLRVNDEIVTLYDYELRKSAEIATLVANPNLAPGDRQERLERIGQEVMQNLFHELLLLSYADQNGIRVSERDVDDAVRDLQERQGISSRAELEQALASAGMTYEQLRANMRRDLIWNQVIGREVHAQVEIGDEELRGYYRNNPDEFRLPERRKLEEVLVVDSSGLSEAERRRLAEEIRRQLAAGAPIEEVAEPHAAQGHTTGAIDLGWLAADELESSLAEAAWALEPGGVSPPVDARGGLHVLRVVEVQEARLQPFEEVEEEIARRERGRRFQRRLRTFMAELEQSALVRENLPPEAVGYRALGESFELEDELDAFRAPIGETPAEDGRRDDAGGADESTSG